MGLLDKVKGILFDEEEVDIPEIKKEPKKEIKQEININSIKRGIKEDNPIRELKIPKDDFSDRNYKSESTFTFPIDFEDEEPVPIKTVEKPKPKPVEQHTREVKNNDAMSSRDFSSFLNKKEDKRRFKPTPIISPVYGVLDQNYKKEDVIVKKDVLRRPNELTIEEVRKRAFGTLEDEIKDNLTTPKEQPKEKIKEKKDVPVIDVVEEPVNRKKTIGELIEEEENSIEIPEINSINVNEEEYTNNSVNELEQPTNSIDDLLGDREEKEDIEIDEEEADLFSLIDSMYEEKGE